jgi:hypothetical protein
VLGATLSVDESACKREHIFACVNFN